MTAVAGRGTAPRRTAPRRPARSPGAPFVRRRVNLLYLPALAVFAVFTVYPLVNGIAISLTKWDGYSPTRTFVGLDNYLHMLADPLVGTALRNTFVYGFGSTILQQVIGLALAVALDRALRGRNLARAIVYLPVLVSPVVMGTMYYLLFSYSYGGLNDIVVALGGQRVAWLSTAPSAITIIVLVNSLQFVGISMVIYLAGLQSIPVTYYEASRIDGAGPWQQFTSITVPLPSPRSPPASCSISSAG
ncbi:carbohydrate ABC transporter permease [Microbacterium elymi]|uniref:Sugar ABC transporter permease n=1 Tax=Microbacterium elymi TaxID=2909587 RepID=A0ABY5NGI9_9MICO|nr:sugar ABC transporter permease [Microbacterium elymi]UUT34277.1 sugar ABC transporter permease [Microbacterium elymi]